MRQFKFTTRSTSSGGLVAGVGVACRSNGVPSGATGATLAETLMAMLVMSIGVVSLASLFPLSVVRSLQATQLTNAANLRYNAEARIDMNRPLLTSNALAVVAVPPVLPPPPTEPKTPFVYLIDPLGWNIAAYSSVPTYYRLGGATGIPRWNAGLNSESAAADLVTLPDSWTAQTKSLPDYAAATPINATSVTFPSSVDLTSVNYTAPYESRVVVFDNTLKRSQVRRITGIAGQTVSWTGSLPVSILEDQNGNNTLDAGEDYDGNGVLSPVGDAWVETRDRRYTWLLNVRRFGNRANVEVVTFFGREFTTEDEQAYAATFASVGVDGKPGVAGTDDNGTLGVDDISEIGWSGSDDLVGADNQPGIAGFDDNGDGTIDNASEKGWPGSDDNRTIHNVNWPTTPRPTIRKGGWVLEPTNGRWYRIRAIYEPSTHTPVQSLSEITGTSVDLVVEKDLLETSATPITAVFLRGVIDVFPIGIKEF